MTFVGGTCDGSWNLDYDADLNEWIANDLVTALGITARFACSNFGFGFEFVLTIDFDTVGFDLISCDPLLLQCLGCFAGTCGNPVDVYITE